MEGWVKLHRKSLESIVFQNANLWQVWCYCLMRANHRETKKLWNQKEETLKEGSFITGRLEGGKDCNMNPNTFYWQLKTLENLNCIEIKSRNKFSIISIINWEKYQTTNNSEPSKMSKFEGDPKNRNNKGIDSKPINKGRNEGEPNFRNNKVTTKEQQNNTDKNDKNEKNKEKRASLFAEKVFNNNGYDKEMLSEFIEYWTESSENQNKMRFEKEKVFDISRRLKAWMRNKEKWEGKKHKEVNIYDDF